MLPRLKKRSDFLHAARRGAKSVTPGLILQVRPYAKGEASGTGGPGAGGSAIAGQGRVPADQDLRVGFTVSRKVGNAVARNRARRRLRAAAELVLSEGAKRGRDYVLIGRRTTVSRPFSALVSDLEHALAQAGAAREGATHVEDPAAKT